MRGSLVNKRSLVFLTALRRERHLPLLDWSTKVLAVQHMDVSGMKHADLYQLHGCEGCDLVTNTSNFIPSYLWTSDFCCLSSSSHKHQLIKNI